MLGKNIIIVILILSIPAYFSFVYFGKNKQKEASSEVGKLNSGIIAAKIPVVVTLAKQRTFRETINVHGSLKSRNFALVAPRIKGVLEKVFVREGNDVIAGKTKLFQTDSVKLFKTVQVNRQLLNVAKCASEVQKAYQEKTAAELRKAQLDLKRNQALYDQNAVSQDVLEDKRSVYEQLLAMQKYAVSQVALAREEEQRTRLALAISEKDMDDSLMLAPISGKVSKRMAEPGEIGDTGTPVVRIDDTKVLEAFAYLPSQYYSQVQIGKTRVSMKINKHDCGEYLISYKSPTVDTTLRTFEIKCDITGDGQFLVPGMLVEMSVILEEKRALSVPRESVQERSMKNVVFVLDGDFACSVSIETGMEADGWIEVKSGNLNPKSLVVSRGQFLLNHGSPVLVQKGDN